MQFDLTTIRHKYDELVSTNISFFYTPDCNLESFAKKLNVNRTYASNFVNQELGMNFSKFLRFIRVTHAEELMNKAPNRKLSTILIECGFTNDMSFRRGYYEKYGMLPSMAIVQKKGRMATA